MHTLRFLLNDELQELTDVDPTLTVLQWLREGAGLCGTKEGCAEGDCGACTVVIGRLDDNNRVNYKAINACILFLPVLDGCQLVTVEHLKSDDGQLHPAQQAMVDHHGSQCGFCTPGFVMSMFAMYINQEERPSRQQVNDTLSGNLCRCTGYRPIIDASQAMYDQPRSTSFTDNAPRIAERLQALQHDGPLVLSHGERQYSAPTNARELDELFAADPKAILLAGGTDVGLWVTKLHRDLNNIIYLGGVPELHNIEDRPDELVIGAAVTHTDAEELIGRYFPDFGEMLRRFASRLIRNSSTVGGNVANGSPIGDSMPVMIALGATVTLRSSQGRRELPLEDLYIDYGKQNRQPGEYVESLTIPKLAANEHFRCYKLSKRFDQDISAVCAAFKVQLDNGQVSDMRTGFGGIAGVPARALKTEAALRGQPWDAATVEQAEQVLINEFTPLTDMRASEEYRRMTTGRLLRKFFIEISQPEASTRVLAEEVKA